MQPSCLSANEASYSLTLRTTFAAAAAPLSIKYPKNVGSATRTCSEDVELVKSSREIIFFNKPTVSPVHYQPHNNQHI